MSGQVDADIPHVDSDLLKDEVTATTKEELDGIMERLMLVEIPDRYIDRYVFLTLAKKYALPVDYNVEDEKILKFGGGIQKIAKQSLNNDASGSLDATYIGKIQSLILRLQEKEALRKDRFENKDELENLQVDNYIMRYNIDLLSQNWAHYGLLVEALKADPAYVLTKEEDQIHKAGKKLKELQTSISTTPVEGKTVVSREIYLAITSRCKSLIGSHTDLLNSLIAEQVKEGRKITKIKPDDLTLAAQAEGIYLEGRHKAESSPITGEQVEEIFEDKINLSEYTPAALEELFGLFRKYTDNGQPRNFMQVLGEWVDTNDNKFKVRVMGVNGVGGYLNTKRSTLEPILYQEYVNKELQMHALRVFDAYIQKKIDDIYIASGQFTDSGGRMRYFIETDLPRNITVISSHMERLNELQNNPIVSGYLAAGEKGAKIIKNNGYTTIAQITQHKQHYEAFLIASQEKRDNLASSKYPALTLQDARAKSKLVQEKLENNQSCTGEEVDILFLVAQYEGVVERECFSKGTHEIKKGKNKGKMIPAFGKKAIMQYEKFVQEYSPISIQMSAYKKQDKEHLIDAYEQEVTFLKTEEMQVTAKVLQAFSNQGIYQTLAARNKLGDGITNNSAEIWPQIDAHEEVEKTKYDTTWRNDPLFQTTWQIISSAWNSTFGKAMQAATGIGLMGMSLWKTDDEMIAARDLKEYFDQEALLMGQPSGMKESWWKPDGSLNITMSNAYSQPTNRIGNMYLIVALSGGSRTLLTAGGMGEVAAGYVGLVGTGATLSVGDYYKEAIDSGLSNKEAITYATVQATGQGLLELVSPWESGLKGFGFTKRLFELKGIRGWMMKIMGEEVQEFMQTGGERAVNIVVNYRTDSTLNDTITRGEVYETVIATAVASDHIARVEGLESSSHEGENTNNSIEHRDENLTIISYVKDVSVTFEDTTGKQRVYDIQTKQTEQLVNLENNDEIQDLIERIPVVDYNGTQMSIFNGLELKGIKLEKGDILNLLGVNTTDKAFLKLLNDENYKIVIYPFGGGYNCSIYAPGYTGDALLRSRDTPPGSKYFATEIIIYPDMTLSTELICVGKDSPIPAIQIREQEVLAGERLGYSKIYGHAMRSKLFTGYMRNAKCGMKENPSESGYIALQMWKFAKGTVGENDVNFSPEERNEIGVLSEARTRSKDPKGPLIPELMKTATGRKYRKKYGDDWEGYYDLEDPATIAILARERAEILQTKVDTDIGSNSYTEIVSAVTQAMRNITAKSQSERQPTAGGNAVSSRGETQNRMDMNDEQRLSSAIVYVKLIFKDVDDTTASEIAQLMVDTHNFENKYKPGEMVYDNGEIEIPKFTVLALRHKYARLVEGLQKLMVEGKLAVTREQIQTFAQACLKDGRCGKRKVDTMVPEDAQKRIEVTLQQTGVSIQEIGSGGNGTVYLVTTADGKKQAIKVIDAAGSKKYYTEEIGRQYVERLLVKNAGIPTFSFMEINADQLTVTTEYVEGAFDPLNLGTATSDFKQRGITKKQLDVLGKKIDDIYKKADAAGILLEEEDIFFFVYNEETQEYDVMVGDYDNVSENLGSTNAEVKQAIMDQFAPYVKESSKDGETATAKEETAKEETAKEETAKEETAKETESTEINDIIDGITVNYNNTNNTEGITLNGILVSKKQLLGLVGIDASNVKFLQHIKAKGYQISVDVGDRGFIITCATPGMTSQSLLTNRNSSDGFITVISVRTGSVPYLSTDIIGVGKECPIRGIEIREQQALMAKKLGYTRIHGTATRGNFFNGYLKNAEWGMKEDKSESQKIIMNIWNFCNISPTDIEFTSTEYDELGTILTNRMAAVEPKPSIISMLMGLESGTGRKYWQKYGDTFDGYYDLEDENTFTILATEKAKRLQND